MEQEAIATMLKDDQENKILIGSFLEASCKEAFEMDDIRQVEMGLIMTLLVFLSSIPICLAVTRPSIPMSLPNLTLYALAA